VDELSEVVCFFAGTESSAAAADGAVGAGSDAIAIPNESTDMVHFLQISTLDGGGTHAIARRIHFDGTNLIERVIGGMALEFDSL
jgi:hypothetical protein